MPSVKQDKIWTDAIRKAVNEYTEDPDDPNGGKIKKINYLAKILVNQATDGNTAALQEIGNRLDGKPSQPVEEKSDTTVTYRIEFVDTSGDEPKLLDVTPTNGHEQRH